MIYVAVIGLGIGEKHLQAIHGFRNFRVKYIFDINKKKSHQIKKKYPDILIAKNENQIFLDSQIQLVCIASYDNYHYQQIKKCIQYKKNIIVEKPMCLTIKQFKSIKQMVRKEKSIKIFSNLVLRTNALFKYFRERIKNKKIFYIEADYLWGRGHKLFQWRSTIKRYSLTLGAGIHMIDLIMWLLNSKPSHVQGFSNNKITKNSSYKKQGIVLAILKFPKNILVKVTANASGIYNHYHEIKIFTEKETLSNSFLGSFSFNKKKNKTSFNLIKKSYPDKENRKNLIRDFISCIFLKKKIKYQTIKEQFDLMSVCFSIDKSVKLKKMIKVRY